MDKRLNEKICEINENARARFCMPAHSGVGARDGLYGCARFDWTEAPGLDNLLCADGVIAECERNIAESMGYKAALMLTQGSTCGMHIAVCACKDRAKTLVAVGNMHKSFYAACRLYGADVLQVKSAEQLEKYPLEKGEIGGVFVTSPDYFGMCQDLTGARKAADRLGAYLAVDEAHAAHFAYSSLLPSNARGFADISLMSMHKTLPVYGGGALLCVNDEKLKPKCEGYRSLIHSTSPNYLVMASMDYADAYMKKNGERDYAKVKKAIDVFSQKLKVGEVVKTDDFTRLVVKVDKKDGYKAMLDLAKRGIYAETAQGDLTVFIVTPFNCDKLGLLAEELNGLEFADMAAEDREIWGINSCKKQQDTLQGDVALVEIDDSLGKVSANDIGVYPPGVPFILRGDTIDVESIRLIKKYRNRLFGLASGRVAVIK